MPSPVPVRLRLLELVSRVLPRGGRPVPDHVVVVVEENHGFDQIRGNSDAGYLNALADGPHAVLLTQSFAVEHPSQPNYLDLFSGSNQGVLGDTVPATTLTTPNLGAGLLAAGRTFVGYSEDLPVVGSLVRNTPGADGRGTGGYWRKHNPWSDWQGSGVNGLPADTNQPFSAFPTDFSKLPTVAFVVPNQAHDMHDGTVAAADGWLRDNLGAYADWAVTHNSLLLVTFDEDDSASANRVFTVLVGGPVASGENAGRVDHFGLLRTIEDFYDLPAVGASGTASPIAGVWAPAADPGRFAVGTDVGDGTASLIRGDGTIAHTVRPFGDFTGSVRAAAADFTGDSTPDLVVGTGPGVATRVRVLDGADPGRVVFDFAPFETAFTGGVFVAAGDLTGDGVPEVVVTPDEGGGPRVRAFDGKGFAPIADFFGIDDPAFRGGARAAIGDVTGDGIGDLIVAAGFGGGPRVAGYDGKALAMGATVKAFADFFAFEQTLRNGVFVTAGDTNGDGFAELIVGGGPGGGPRVAAFDGRALRTNDYTLRANFFAGDPNNRGGIRVAAKDLDGDALADLVVGSGPGTGSRVMAYSGATLSAVAPVATLDFDAGAGFLSGVFVG